jgi:cytochrome c oxidase subunit 2
MIKWLGLPALASEHGAALDHTTALVHWLMLILFVGWGIFFVYVLVRFRKGANPKASYHGVQSHASTWLEGAVAVAEAVLLVGFSIPLWADRVDDFPPMHQATVVRVVAEQFAWNVHYPGPDGVFGRTTIEKLDVASNPLGLDRSDPAAKDDVTTVNQLHFPVDKPVIVQLSSKDVIHSFALQEFRVKQDAIPGLTIPVWFKPTVTTAQMRQQKGLPEWNYEIACAQLCGIGHYRMQGFVTVHDTASWEAWMAEQQAGLATEPGDEFWQ